MLHGAAEIEQLWDPVFVLAQITSPLAPPGLDAPIIADGTTRMIVAVIALFGVAVATISVNIAANVVSPANDFANLAPRHISFKAGGVMTDDFIDGYIALKMQEVTKFRAATHPLEYQLYYGL